MPVTYLTPHIITIRSVLSPDECHHLIAQAQEHGIADQDFGRTGRPDVRGRLALDEEELAAKLWERIGRLVPPLSQLYQAGLSPQPTPTCPLDSFAPIGLNTRMRYYRYYPGQRFPPHFDLSFEVGPRERSFLTVIIYLNDESVGGETLFASISVKPEPGMALLFPHEVMHQGGQIVSGVKWVLRTDVMYRAERCNLARLNCEILLDGRQSTSATCCSPTSLSFSRHQPHGRSLRKFSARRIVSS